MTASLHNRTVFTRIWLLTAREGNRTPTALHASSQPIERSCHSCLSSFRTSLFAARKRQFSTFWFFNFHRSAFERSSSVGWEGPDARRSVTWQKCHLPRKNDTRPFQLRLKILEKGRNSALVFSHVLERSCSFAERISRNERGWRRSYRLPTTFLRRICCGQLKTSCVGRRVFRTRLQRDSISTRNEAVTGNSASHSPDSVGNFFGNWNCRKAVRLHCNGKTAKALFL